MFLAPPVPDYDVTELALDDPKRMFDLGADAGLGLFQFLQDGTHGSVFFQGPALARHHGNVPLHLWVFGLDFIALFNTPVTRVGKDIRFLPVQQRVRLGDVVRVGGSGRHAVHQTLVRIRANMNTKGLPASW